MTDDESKPSNESKPHEESKPSLQALIDAIQKLWHVFHPPAFAAIAGIAAAYALVGPFELLDQGPGVHGFFSDTAMDRIEKLGLKSLLPAIALAVLVLALQLVRQIVEALGELLPPFIVLRTETLFQAFLGDQALARAWSAYDQATDLDQLDVIVDREIERIGSTSRTTLYLQIQKWSDQLDNLKWWAILFKVFLYGIPVLAAIAVLRLGRDPSSTLIRAALLEAAATIVYGFIIIRLLHAIQQYTASRLLFWSAARNQSATAVDPDTVARRLEQLNTTAHGRWWAIVVRNPIGTSRLSELLKERMNKDDVSSFQGGPMI